LTKKRSGIQKILYLIIELLNGVYIAVIGKEKTVLERKQVNSRIVETEPKSSLNRNAKASQSF